MGGEFATPNMGRAMDEIVAWFTAATENRTIDYETVVFLPQYLKFCVVSVTRALT